MGRIGRLTRMGMCGALALAGAAPALAQPLTVQLRDQPREDLPAADDAGYRWIDDAGALLDAIGDAPPDFSFAYGRSDIWGWRTGTGHEIYAEPLGGGAIRYYYFEPGDREPFLVQDENLAFGFRPGGRLIVVYDRDGRLLSPGEAEAGLADRLYRRGRAIHASAQNERGWDAVDAGDWAEHVPVIVNLRLRWSSGRERHPGWQRWHGHAGAAKWRAPLADERQRRWAEGDRFRRWQRDGFRGARPGPGMRPPPPGSRPGTTPPSRPGPAPIAEAPIDTSPEVEPARRADRPGWRRPEPPAPGVIPGSRPPRVERPTPSEPPRARSDRPRFARPPGFAPIERPHASPPVARPAEAPQVAPHPAPPPYVAPPPSPPPPEPRVNDRPVEQPQ